MHELPGMEDVKGMRPEGGPQSEPAPRLKPINRKQLLLRPVDVERLVPEDHEVRAIWEFTGHLDLTAYYQAIHAVEGSAGCTAFDPRLLVGIWIYAYSKGIGSAREISRLCEYDPAYQWLTDGQPEGPAAPFGPQLAIYDATLLIHPHGGGRPAHSAGRRFRFLTSELVLARRYQNTIPVGLGRYP